MFAVILAHYVDRQSQASVVWADWQHESESIVRLTINIINKYAVLYISAIKDHLTC